MENAEKDGMYRYRWETRFGRHTVYFLVSGGIIKTNPARKGDYAIQETRF